MWWEAHWWIIPKKFLISNRNHFQKNLCMYNELSIQGQRNFLFSEMEKFPCLRYLRERAVQSRVSWEIRLNGQDEWISSGTGGKRKKRRARKRTREHKNHTSQILQFYLRVALELPDSLSFKIWIPSLFKRMWTLKYILTFLCNGFWGHFGQMKAFLHIPF